MINDKELKTEGEKKDERESEYKGKCGLYTWSTGPRELIQQLGFLFNPHWRHRFRDILGLRAEGAALLVGGCTLIL